MYNNHQHGHHNHNHNHSHSHGPAMAYSQHQHGGMPASAGRKPGMINLDKITNNSSSG
jgi:hypothetical protein